MKKKTYIAGCLAVTLVGFGIWESEGIVLADEHAFSFEPRIINSLVGNPHSHLESYSDGDATTAFSVSGGQQNKEMFRLFIHPASSGFNLIARPFSPEPDGRPAQSMNGFCSNIESLAETLLKAGLPPTQVDAIRRGAINGVIQEVGGSRSPVIRLFRRSKLTQIGMTFGPSID